MSASLPPVAAAPAEAARMRLLRAGLKLFAAQGYARTSTRELADAAAVNVASIAYYFGDKAGLYRAVFFEPMAPHNAALAALARQTLPLPEALRQFYAVFLEPLKRCDEARLCVKLHLREILEPTGLWQQEVAEGIRPQHEHLVQLLCGALGLAAPDDDVQRLALGLSALAVQLHVSAEIIDTLAPQLMADAAAVECWTDRLQTYALGMVEAERQRRARAASAT